MKKKKRRKQTDKVVDAGREVKPMTEKAASSADELSGVADYGGLPDRDLKKNLGGCG